MNRYLSKQSFVLNKTIRTCINDPWCDPLDPEASKWKIGWLEDDFFRGGWLEIEDKNQK